MSEQFKNQGGVANMDPSPLKRWLASKVMCRLALPGRVQKKRKKFDQKLRKRNGVYVVEYFHQVDDPYSHLAAQILGQLSQRFSIQLHCHLVSSMADSNSPEPQLLSQLARDDAGQIAPFLGLDFPPVAQPPDPHLLEMASAILAAQTRQRFVACATEVGNALWVGDAPALQCLAQQYGRVDDTQPAVVAGNRRRRQLGHYSGAMFYCAQEWYWGVDRLSHLQQRLREAGADRQPDRPFLVERPVVDGGVLTDDGSLTLEIYPSLRSPYTAIAFDRAVQLASDTGVKLRVRPVLPMVMRGVPATREKMRYIFTDAVREARRQGVAFGRCYDPIGEPVRRCYSLYPWACEQGRGVELLSSFLSCVWAEGVNTNSDKGMRKVVEKAGLDWAAARQIIGTTDWQDAVESNRRALYDAGFWGVPAYRLLDSGGQQLFAAWGQDRLWLLAKIIQQQLSAKCG